MRSPEKPLKRVCAENRYKWGKNWESTEAEGRRQVISLRCNCTGFSPWLPCASKPPRHWLPWTKAQSSSHSTESPFNIIFLYLDRLTSLFNGPRRPPFILFHAHLSSSRTIVQTLPHPIRLGFLIRCYLVGKAFPEFYVHAWTTSNEFPAILDHMASLTTPQFS